MGNENYTQVAPNSSGNKIRNISADIIQADGTISTVQMQVVSIVDENGNYVDFDNSSYQHAMLEKLDTIIRLLLEMF